jgi:hypothetical protein
LLFSFFTKSEVGKLLVEIIDRVWIRKGGWSLFNLWRCRRRDWTVVINLSSHPRILAELLICLKQMILDVVSALIKHHEKIILYTGNDLKLVSSLGIWILRPHIPSFVSVHDQRIREAVMDRDFICFKNESVHWTELGFVRFSEVFAHVWLPNQVKISYHTVLFSCDLGCRLAEVLVE